MHQSLIHRMAYWFLGALFLYAFFLLVLWAFQEQLIFFPGKMNETRWKEVAEDLGADYATIRVTQEGRHLQGWFLQDLSEQPRPTIIYFGGNAERMQDTAYILAPLREQGINVLLMDYRGYGLSEGKPAMDAFRHDAEILFESAKQNPLVDPARIIVMGHSMGTGVAASLAANKAVEKVILLSPMTSLTDVAADAYWFIPRFLIDPLLRHNIRTVAIAPSVMQPVLIVYGTEDTVVTPEQSEQVADAWGGPVTLVEVQGAGHDNLLASQEVWNTVINFLKEDGAAHEI